MWARPDPWLNAAASERLGYATQKPLALLERIIHSSSKTSNWSSGNFMRSKIFGLAAKPGMKYTGMRVIVLT